MRDIRFRGKAIDGGSWVYGYYVYTFEIGYSPQGLYDVPPRRHYLFGNSGDFCEVDPETVGQYTGLPDRYGKEIYKGDICRDSLGWVFVVEWDNDGSRFIGRHSKPRGDTYICYVGREPAVEVIGNIYDNPELLGEVRE